MARNKSTTLTGPPIQGQGSPYMTRVQYPMDRVSRLAPNDPRRRGRSDWKGEETAGFSKDTWKVGFIFSDVDKNNLLVTGLLSLKYGKD